MSSPIETFESLLKDVVTSKRLSASKMTKLSDFTLKNIAIDTQLVTTLYRTHKNLPPSNKVSSLYAFDALARAAKHQTDKRNISAKTEGGGNPTTFLMKMEGVLEGLFEDLMTTSKDIPEAKEKAKKVLDIWTKAGTFPSRVLTKLSDLTKANDSEQVPSRVVSDPRRPVKSPVNEASTTPPFSPPSESQPAQSVLPPALLALLGAAAQANAQPSNAAPPTSATPESVNVAAQLAVLQQLAAARGLVNNAPPSVPAPLPVPNVNPFDQNHQSQGVNNYTTNGRDVERSRDPRTRFTPPEHNYSQDHNPNYDRNDPRLSERDEYYSRRSDYPYRGSSSRGSDPRRGRGRGAWRGGRGDYRGGDYDYRARSRSRSPPPRREDPRRGRGGRPYSPPRRVSSYDRSSPPQGLRTMGRGAGDSSSLDEFGRESRPQVSNSPEPSAHIPQNRVPDPRSQPPAPMPPSAPRRAPPPPVQQYSRPIPTFDSFESTSVPPPPPPQSQPITQQIQTYESTASTSTPAPIPSTSTIQSPTVDAPYLSEFDFSAFDFSLPASWEALGASFQVTYGYMPSQEDLTNIMMMAMSPQMASAGNEMDTTGSSAENGEPMVSDADGAYQSSNWSTNGGPPNEARVEDGGGVGEKTVQSVNRNEPAGQGAESHGDQNGKVERDTDSVDVSIGDSKSTTAAWNDATASESTLALSQDD